MMKMLNEYNDGEHFSGQLLVNTVSKGTNANGKQYISSDLRDASMVIPSKKWDVMPGDENIIIVGNVIHVEGEILKYKESLQLKILGVSSVNSEDVDVNLFVKAPPIPREELVQKFKDYIHSIKDNDCLLIIKYLLNKYHDRFLDFPAGVSVHHDYACGLLMHVTKMADLADKVCELYQDINRDLLITGVLIHDIGKVIELVGPVIYKYSTEGKLLGHLAIGAAEVRMAAYELKITSETPLLLQHMILSHHGQLEFGSPVLPQTKEAIILSMLDNLDSRINIVDKALEATKEKEFSSRISALDGRCIYKDK